MLGLVLSGGGARGAYQAGVYEELAKDERFERPDVLSGTSAGAINAALIASGKSPAEVSQFWLDLGTDAPVTTNTALFRSGFLTATKLALGGARIPTVADLRSIGRRVLRHLVPDPGDALALGVELLLAERFDLVDRFLSDVEGSAIVDTQLFRERLVATFGGERIRTDRALAISVVEATSHQVVRFVNRPVRTASTERYVVVDHITVDMVLASASVPLLFPSIAVKEAGGSLCWDGGVLVNTPMAPAVALGAERLVPILSTLAPGAPQRPIRFLGDAVEHLGDTLLENSYNLDRKLLLERNRLAPRHPGYRSVDLYLPIRPDGGVFTAGSYLYFQRPALETMRDLGRTSAQRWLQQGPGLDQLPPPRPPVAPGGPRAAPPN